MYEPENEELPAHDDAELEIVEQAEEDEAGQEDDSDELVVSFGDEEPAPVAEEAAPAWVKDLRREHRELKRENERLRQSHAPAKIEVGPEPTLEAFDYDEDAFKSAWRKWTADTLAAEDQRKTELAEQEKIQTRGREIVSRYEQAARALPVKDFDDAQEAVKDALGIERWGYIVAGADAPERLVYALAKNPAKLAALAKIDIPARFAFEAAKLEKDMKVGKRKAPEPDEIVRGAAPLSAKVDATELRLEKEADKTGDRSELQKYRRQKAAQK
jgi:hypothetical protein